jgi:hypothetical protein
MRRSGKPPAVLHCCTLRVAGRGSLLTIAMTGASSVETAQKAKDAGFDAHMVKLVAMEDKGILGCAGFPLISPAPPNG